MSVAKSVASSVAQSVAASVGVSGDGGGAIGYDVWLVIGQSNATGTNDGFQVGIDDEIHPRAKQWPFGGPFVDTLYDAVDEMWHQDWNGARTGLHVGYGAKFCRLYADTVPANRTAVVVPAGWGGTVALNWMPDTGQSIPAGGLLLPPAIAQVEEVLALSGVNSFKGVLWLQGEGDQAGDPAVYRTRLDEIIAYFQTNYPGSLFMIGQMVPGYFRTQLFERAGVMGPTDQVTGLITGHNIGSGEIVSAYWDGGIRTGITAFDPQTNAIRLSGGTGTTLPSNGTAITLRENVTANINLINDEHIAAPGRSANIRTAFWWAVDNNNTSIHYTAAEQRSNAQTILDTLATARANVIGSLPLPPTNLTALVIGAKSVQIGWKHPVSRVTKFQVKWRESGGSWATIDTSSRAITYYFRTLAPNTTYEFAVFATNETGNSIDSDILTVVVNVPNAPTALTAGTTTTSAVPLSWSAPSTGAVVSDYVVQYSLAGADSWSTFADGTSTATTATVTGLTSGTAYDFRVAGSNASGVGTYSSTATATTETATTNTWDAATKSADLSLDGTSRTVLGNTSGSNAFRSVLSLIKLATGKRYVEVHATTPKTGRAQYSVGVANATGFTGQNSALGQTANAAGFYGGTNSTLTNAFTVVNEATGLIVTANTLQIYMLAIDMAAKKVWVGKNGTWNGDPAAGTGEWLSWTSSFSALAVGVTDFYSTASTDTPSLNLPTTQTYLPPSGFTQGNG